MFVGHLGIALAAKTVSPRTSLGTLVGASFGLDLVWPLLLAAGVEHVRVAPGNTAFTPLAFDNYPWSHSLVTACGWGLVAALAAGLRRRTIADAVVVGVVVVSHWALDALTHRPDLPLWPGGPLVGLGLWNSVPATLLVEGAMFIGGVEAYRRRWRPRNRAGAWLFGSLVVLTAVIWISGPFSPPPPSAGAVAAVAVLMWLFPLWARAIERHRLSTWS